MFQGQWCTPINFENIIPVKVIVIVLKKSVSQKKYARTWEFLHNSRRCVLSNWVKHSCVFRGQKYTWIYIFSSCMSDNCGEFLEKFCSHVMKVK